MPSPRTVLISALALFAMPAAAQATDYCVMPENSCTVANTFPATGAGVQMALDAAGADPVPDRVLIGAGTYTAPNPTGVGFNYFHPGSPVNVVGRGGAQTVLTGPVLSNPVVFFDGGPLATITDLGIKVPANPGPSFPEALHLISTARRLAVTGTAGLVGTNGVTTDGGTFEDGTIDFPMSGPFVAANTSSAAGGAIRNTVIHASRGLRANTDNMVWEGLDVTAGTAGAEVGGAGTKLQDSIIRMSGNADAISVQTNGTSPTLLANHVTLVGDGTASANGVFVDAFNLGSASADVRNSIITGFGHSFNRLTTAPGTSTTITSQYSDYDPAGNVSSGAGTLQSPGPGDINAPPQLDAAFSPLAGSPAIDKGAPGALGAEPLVDRIGNPRLLDGDGDCVARRDMGALERQLGAAPCPPPANLPVVPPAAPGGGGGTQAKDTTKPVLSKLAFKKGKIKFTLSEAAKIVVKAGKKTKTAQGKAGVNSLKIGKLTKGRYTARFTATDAAGNNSSAKLKFRIR